MTRSPSLQPLTERVGPVGGADLSEEQPEES